MLRNVASSFVLNQSIATVHELKTTVHKQESKKIRLIREF